MYIFLFLSAALVVGLRFFSDEDDIDGGDDANLIHVYIFLF